MPEWWPSMPWLTFSNSRHSADASISCLPSHTTWKYLATPKCVCKHWATIPLLYSALSCYYWRIDYQCWWMLLEAGESWVGAISTRDVWPSGKCKTPPKMMFSLSAVTWLGGHDPAFSARAAVFEPPQPTKLYTLFQIFHPSLTRGWIKQSNLFIHSRLVDAISPARLLILFFYLKTQNPLLTIPIGLLRAPKPVK